MIDALVQVGPGIGWFPQEYAQIFFWIKGALSMVACLLLIIHMVFVWNWKVVEGDAQRWRYLALFAYAALGTASTLEQLEARVPVRYSNIGVFICITALLIAMIKSIRDDVRLKRSWRKNDPNHAKPGDLPGRLLHTVRGVQDQHLGVGRAGSSRSDRGYGQVRDQNFG